MRPYQGFWGTGEQGHFFRETGEQRPKIKGNTDNLAILGNIEKEDFVLGEHGNKAIFSRGTKEQVPPPPPGGPQK